MSHFYPDIHVARIQEAMNRLRREIFIERIPLKATVAVTPEPVPYEKRKALPSRAIRQGEAWGRAFECGWFHVTGAVPKEWKGAHVVMHLDFGGESLVFDAQGCPLVGLTNGSVFAWPGSYSKDVFHWLPKAKGGEKADFWIDAGANNMFGVTRLADPAAQGAAPAALHGTYNAAVAALELARFDVDKWALLLDLETVFSLDKVLPENASRRIRVLRATSRALDLLPPERGGAAAVREALRPEVFDVGADPAATKVTAIGHAHIDVEWLWPLRETVRKVARTFSSQIGLMERYPGFKFGASQAQLYALCKEHYPKLYKKVRKAVADGTWELQGGMWVEADCNIPSGESLVRQFLVGERFFKREFGIVPRNLWLPDVFGYSGNLPQILQACGIDFFLTQKLSWNRYNKFPHNSFVWRGIDGSEVVAHFPPEDTYNADLTPASLAKHETNNREAGIVDVAISLFGMGDGGGGPKEEHVEMGLRAAHLNGCPPVTFGFAQDAMDKIAAQRADLDTWCGELYFEMHRGTFTTQAAQKLANRRAEEALRVSEMLCAAAAGARPYPAAAFEKLWEELLLCQFHDIIPGSSIHRVYEESGALIRGVAEKALDLADKAAAALLAKEKDALALFNPSSTPFEGAVALPKGWRGAALGGKALPAQREGSGATVRVAVPPRSFVTLRKAAPAKGTSAALPAAKGARGPFVLENGRVRYEIDPATLRVVRALDKDCGRVFIEKAAPGNALALFDDHPSSFDAWDIEEYAADMPTAEPAVESVVPFAGPVSSGLRAAFRIGGTRFTQTIRLGADGKRLDFETATGNWCEAHKLLRVAFPTTVRADEARFEIQYGTVARATHDNTKWQYAQFESCAHRYADLSEPGFGVALLNDCKYGYRVKDGVLSLSLLRAPTEPDPVADRGPQRFTYSLLPHAGTLLDGDDVVAAAAVLNQGLARFEGLSADGAAPLPVALEGEGVELAVLKKAEDSDDLVLRLVERRGRRAEATLTAAKGTKAQSCLATELADLGKPFALPARLSFRPFEMKTLRLSR